MPLTRMGSYGSGIRCHTIARDGNGTESRASRRSDRAAKQLMQKVL